MTQVRGIAPVDFLIVGTARAGTTTLFEILRRHPDIFVPQRKECRYFSDLSGNFAGPGAYYANAVTPTLEKYTALFKRAGPDQTCGDISPDYLYHYQNAVPKILREAGAQIPIIIVLRNPIDRAYSHYLHRVRDGTEKLSFEDALAAEEERRAANWAPGWFYADRSLYADAVRAYRDNFDRVLVLLFEEDIVTGRAAGKILKFLNLPPHPGGIPAIHVNTAGYPRSRLMHWVIAHVLMDEVIVRKIKNAVERTPFFAESKHIHRKILESNVEKQAMEPGTRKRLKEKFRADVATLAQQTGLPVYQYWTDFTSRI